MQPTKLARASFAMLIASNISFPRLQTPSAGMGKRGEGNRKIQILCEVTSSNVVGLEEVAAVVLLFAPHEFHEVAVSNSSIRASLAIISTLSGLPG